MARHKRRDVNFTTTMRGSAQINIIDRIPRQYYGRQSYRIISKGRSFPMARSTRTVSFTIPHALHHDLKRAVAKRAMSRFVTLHLQRAVSKTLKSRTSKPA